MTRRFDPARALWNYVSEAARTAPEATAVIVEGERLTYRELCAAAEQIAARLVLHGVGPGDFVGLVGSRSVEAIVATLAITRTGAAYAPLDPTHAAEQLGFIAKDLPLKAALVLPGEEDLADDILPRRLVRLAFNAALIDRTVRPETWPEATGEDPAYVMYTSGTTGTPKGVVIPHRAMAAFCLDQPVIGIRPDDVVLHASTIACDGGLIDLWPPLVNGAAIAIVEAPKPALDEVTRVMREAGVTAMFLYTGVHQLLVDHHLGAFTGVRLALCGGDVMSPEQATRLKRAYPDLKLVNIYGPTETTCASLVQEVTEAQLTGAPIPIGSPIAYDDAFIADDELSPLPDGETGQLVLAGAGVGIGYHGRPERTAETFVPDPRPGHVGTVYLTGDLARRDTDGLYHFAGRVDRQVKLGGRRIELDGIEHVIRAQPGVGDAAVEVVTARGGDRRIAAILRPEGAMPADPAAFARTVLDGAARELERETLPRLTRVLPDLPLTPAGKIDRKALRAGIEAEEAEAPVRTRPKAGSVRAVIARVWDEILACGPLSDDTTFFEAGGTSLQLIDAHARIEARLNRTFPITTMFEVPRLGDLARRLGDISQEAASERSARDKTQTEIAIVGMAARIPGAPSLAAFWEHVRKGDNLIPRFAPEELEDRVPNAVRADPAYVPARPYLDGVDMFDAKYFGVLPREAAQMDPQARVFLEICVEALEDAGLDPGRHGKGVGVFAGSSMSTYMLNNLMADRATIEEFTSTYQLGDYSRLTGNITDSLATRVAFKLNLNGPAMTVHTACSTSLTAISQAVQALRSGQADAALAGGISITFPQKRGYLAQEGGMASPDGVCRPFDAEAGGTVFGSGAGVVVLKRLEDAEADGDRIYAVIRGVGLNNDGAGKISYTAPSVTGQADAIRMAHLDAGISPDEVSFVECHGTATPLGDPIEVRALAEAFGTGGETALGSVKGNIGHLDAAAGAVSVIKTALMLTAREIPPVANFRSPNPRITFEGTPFRVPSALEPWLTDGPRIAGVSSFGVGGTNVHLVLQEAPPLRDATPTTGCQILPISAKSPEALTDLAQAMAGALEASEASLADIAFTLQDGRTAHPHRGVVVAETRAHAAEQFAAFRPSKGTAAASPPVVFMFPGQGSQYPNMGRGLYEREPAFRTWIDRGTEILRPMLDVDLAALLRPEDTRTEDAARALRDTAVTQPALYLVQYALAKLWEARGIRPDAMVGHSVGEFTAAALAGVFSFEDGLSIIAARGRLMQDQPGGAMLSVRTDAATLARHLVPGTDIAAQNAPNLQVAAGPFDAIDALEAKLTEVGIATTRLHTSHAFHSAMMDPVVPTLRDVVAGLSLHAPSIPYVSCVSGDWITETQATDPAYWGGQARAAVDFRSAITKISEMGQPVLVEVGAGGTLSAFSRQTLERERHGGVVHSLPDHTQTVTDEHAMALAFGQLWAAGVPVDWALSGPRGAQKVALPTYPFQRQRHWVDPPPPATREAVSAPPPVAPVPVTNEVPMPNQVDRLPRIEAELIAMFSDLSGETLGGDDADAPFLELGFDSLFLGQVSQALSREYGVDLSFRTLLSDYPSIRAVAQHLDGVLPPDPAPAPAAEAPVAQAAPAPAQLPAPAAMPAATGDLAALLQAQMQTMQSVFAEQLRVLGGAAATATAAPAPVPAPAPAAQPKAVAKPEAAKTEEDEPKKSFTVGRAPSLAMAELTPAQQAFADDLAKRYSEKYKSSKAHTQAYRARHADPRTAAGFRPEWKELTFPIVAERSKGAHIWDLDGNRLIDVVNGFGQTAFGHSPDFVAEAVKAQLDRGYAIGPQHDRAGPVAERFAKWVGHERVTFCNTGSEAVMAAMRLARAVTGRDKIVVFSNDYHGQFDEVLVKGKARGGEPAALPIAPGIPRSGLANMVVVPYGTDDSLAWIRENIGDIAAVILEPVQSRYPALRPEAFCRSLRDVTRDGGAALVFDEVVTGFRTGPQGMQGVWGIEADMATYGKVVGGGMPIGVLAGSRRFMDALDGGSWSFGDDSKPETAPTFFAGTFVRHPLVVAAVEAVLDHLEGEGAALYGPVVDRAASLGQRMNRVLTDRGLPEMVQTYSSWFVIKVSNHDPRATLLYPLMRLNGVHILDGFCGFLTTTHTDEDCEAIFRAFEDGIDALQSVDILAPEGAVSVPAAPAASVAPAAETAEDVPLTEGQREIWMTHQLGDEAAASFNEGLSLRLEGRLNEMALTRALSALIARHDALRMVFARDGSAFDVIAPYAPDLVLTDLTGEADAKAAFEALLQTEAETPIDLTAGPPLRTSLVRLGSSVHVLVMTAHHIAVDGWSYNTLITELAALYAAEAEGRKADLPAAPSFAGHARAVAGKAPDPQVISFWKDQYGDIPALPDLPTDRPRGARKSFRGGTVTEHIDAEAMKAVQKAGAKAGCTLFSTLFAGLQITLCRLSGATDVVLGVPTGGQALLDDPSLVGHMVNFLPIRAPFDPAAPVADHLKSVGARVMAAFDHQDTTYGALVRELGVPRTLDRLPLTEVQFNLEKMADDLPMGGLTARTAPNPKAAVNFDLFFNVIESREGLRIDVDYNADLYDADTVRRWVGHLRTMLAAMAADTATPVAALPLLAEEETRALAGASANPKPYDLSQRIEALIAETAAAHGARVAAEDAAGALTHAELAAASDALAAAIQQVLPEPGARVAVALQRGTEMLTALLAVLKAGHAYVPLDPSQPEARLRTICETAEVAAVVAEDAVAFTDAPVIRPSAATPGARPEARNLSAEDAAYVIFTSGSTGAPKGVEVSHRAVVNFLRSMAEAPGFTADDTILAVTTVMFDIAVLELFLPLVTGGRTVIAARADVLDGFRIVKRIAAGDITVMQATPTLWSMLLEAGLQPRADLKILAGGEPIPTDLAERLMADGAALWNMYGPTETTVWSAIARLEPGAPVALTQTVANTELHVLGPDDALLPVGVTGELNIGGAGLANGYFQRPDLTEAAFRDVTIDGTARRLYRTGDMARRMADGRIEILGRRDDQIKLRGFRIELGEIEAALRAQPGVDRAAVALKTRPNGDKRLVAYVTGTADTGTLAPALAATLPDYMVPQVYVPLSALPETANGKLDRKALPDPDETAEVAPLREVTAAETPTEQRIAAIWAEVLGVEAVSVTDTIHALGVDSLIVFRIAARMLDAGLDLEAKDVLAHPSIRALAAHADSRAGEAPKPKRPSLKDFRKGARRAS